MGEIRIGQRASGQRVAYDELVTVEGVVVSIDRYTADGKPRMIVNVKTDNGWADWFGLDEKPIPQPKSESKKLPSWAVGYCHYCGSPANSFGFFDEPVCRECGG